MKRSTAIIRRTPLVHRSAMPHRREPIRPVSERKAVLSNAAKRGPWARPGSRRLLRPLRQTPGVDAHHRPPRGGGGAINGLRWPICSAVSTPHCRFGDRVSHHAPGGGACTPIGICLRTPSESPRKPATVVPPARPRGPSGTGEDTTVTIISDTTTTSATTGRGRDHVHPAGCAVADRRCQRQRRAS